MAIEEGKASQKMASAFLLPWSCLLAAKWLSIKPSMPSLLPEALKHIQGRHIDRERKVGRGRRQNQAINNLLNLGA
jgi:hypothetical protein